MEGLMQPDRLRARILLWAEEEIRSGQPARQGPGRCWKRSCYRGELPRGEVAALLGTGDRQARRVVSRSAGARRPRTPRVTRAPLFLAFPAALAPRWMPGLFPEQPS